jgi:hypothetical protein
MGSLKRTVRNDKHLGPLDIDRFASDKNKKLPRFNSLNKALGKETESIDALSQIWKGS